MRQILVTNCFSIAHTGTLFDLSTNSPVWDIIDFGPGNRLIAPTSTTILDALPTNGNLTASIGRGELEGNIFNGTGTAITGGITSEDKQWNMTGNAGVDDTKVDCDAFLLPASPPQVVTIGSIGVYVAIAGAEWDTDIENRFTVSTAGLITYTGIEDINVDMIATTTLTKVGGGADLICTKIAKGGTVIDKTVGCTENPSPTQVTSQLLIELTTNDTLQLFVGNEGSTANIEITNSVITVKGK